MKVKITIEIDDFDLHDHGSLPDLVVTMFGGMAQADQQAVVARLKTVSGRLGQILHPPDEKQSPDS